MTRYLRRRRPPAAWKSGLAAASYSAMAEEERPGARG
jgi:hypothetical protein